MSKPASKLKSPKATSTEITGGAGFTYEDKVVAYYLAALLREEGGALQDGIVKSVAVQQSGHDSPMDDLVVEFEAQGIVRRLDLQIKTGLSISSGNKAFGDVLARAVEVRTAPNYDPESDCYGFIAENIAVAGLQSLGRLIDWAKASPDAAHFQRRFEAGGSAATAERNMRDDLKTLIKAKTPDDEWRFYRQFVGARFDGLAEGGILHKEIVGRLEELVSPGPAQQSELLFDRLCRLVREGAGTAQKWTRQSLLAQLSDKVRLKIAPNYRADLRLIAQFSDAGLTDIADDIEGFEVQRPALLVDVEDKLNAHRVVNISGLPGCGKSVVLRRAASTARDLGPIFFLKSDRLTGKSWLEFAANLGLQHRYIEDLLAEIGATGSAVLYIDGIDRINPDQKRIVLDVLQAIERTPSLFRWKVLATSRDQGLETYRSWFPPSFYKGSTIGDVQVKPFNDVEAEALAEEKPGLRRLLMGTPAVQAIARRPFFAAVLARSFPDDAAEPQTETDLINAWWERAGHDAPPHEVPQRQRALLDLAEKGVGNLGKNIAARRLCSPTFGYVAALKADLIVRGHDGDASFSFAHDIFFEWAFFRLLIDLGEDWLKGLADAGEPPLLGRVVALLAQHRSTAPGKWTSGYAALERSALRSQWRREWLTAPPFTSAFDAMQQEFTDLLLADDQALLEKVLVWFQAQHTIPSPVVLEQDSQGAEGIDRIRLAEVLSWPSDFAGWARFLDWVIGVASDLSVRLLPNVVEIFAVWQNALHAFPNGRSEAIVRLCSEWLAELENALYPEKLSFDRGRWDTLSDEAGKQFATALRIIIIRAAQAYPNHTNTLLDRAIEKRRMRQAAYSDLMSLAWMIAEVSPAKLAAVAKAELFEELPQERVDREERHDRERGARVRNILSKPESERTEAEKTSLSGVYIPRGRSELDESNIGINRSHTFYFPVSALHEPFASLFAKSPETALELVNDLSNRAITGWRQVHSLGRHQGTPIPVTVDFPWGEQHFWGNWQVYNWHLGQLAAQPLECAFLALGFWAYREIEKGRAVDEVVKLVVQGNDSIAAAGLGLALANETLYLSDTTLALVTCQRLWRYDIARVRQEPNRNLDLFGFGFLSKLTGEKAKAQAFLEARESRTRDVRQLAMKFVVGADARLRQHFKTSIDGFPTKLPYELEEQRSNDLVTEKLSEESKEYAAIANVENYRKYRTADNQMMVAYQQPISQEKIERAEAAETYLTQQSVLAWSMKSLRNFTLDPAKTLSDAVALARPLYHSEMFAQHFDVGEDGPQSLVAAVAACVVCFDDRSSADYAWALEVLSKVDDMKERAGAFHGSKISWHPANQLVFALLHDRVHGSGVADG